MAHTTHDDPKTSPGPIPHAHPVTPETHPREKTHPGEVPVNPPQPGFPATHEENR